MGIGDAQAKVFRLGILFLAVNRSASLRGRSVRKLDGPGFFARWELTKTASLTYEQALRAKPRARRPGPQPSSVRPRDKKQAIPPGSPIHRAHVHLSAS